MFAGIQALRSILNKFSVNNRKNMFVFRENNGSVFYLRSVESYLRTSITLDRIIVLKEMQI